MTFLTSQNKEFKRFYQHTPVLHKTTTEGSFEYLIFDAVLTNNNFGIIFQLDKEGI